jgi:hypothetical protein
MTVLKDERERGWFHLDNAVIDVYLPKVGPIAFAVYASIVRHSDRNGIAFPSYTKLQQELGTGRTQIANAIRIIVDAGLITFTTEKEEGKQKKNIYRVITPQGSPAERLVPQRNQSLRETTSSPAERPMVVPQRDSNNTHRTRPTEQDPVVASQPRARLADFQPNEKQRADAIGYGVPSERIAFETEQWRDYHAEKGTPIKDFGASWRRWMRNAPTFTRGSPNGRAEQKPWEVVRREASQKVLDEWLAKEDGNG